MSDKIDEDEEELIPLIRNITLVKIVEMSMSNYYIVKTDGCVLCSYQSQKIRDPYLPL
jgi:hypothetical protein